MQKGITKSHKPFGVACYYLHYPWVKKKNFFLFDVWERSNSPAWLYLYSNYYMTKKNQMRGFFDLCNNFKEHKFVAFKNDIHPMLGLEQLITIRNK